MDIQTIFALNRPVVAASFKDKNSVAQITRFKPQLDIAELRVDLFEGECSANSVASELAIFKRAQMPTILTIRSQFEGGQWRYSDLERVHLMAECLPFASAIDVEMHALETGECAPQFVQLIAQAHKLGVQFIASHHNFAQTPSLEKLSQTIAKAKNIGADVVKIACKINQPNDLIVLTQLLINHPNTQLIVIGMGDLGLLTRLSFPAYGSRLTFAYVNESPSAPGQISLDKMTRYLAEIYPATDSAICPVNAPDCR